MKWAEVPIRRDDSYVPLMPTLSESRDGLSSDAFSSHQRFFSDINHMTEVIDNHEGFTKMNLSLGDESSGGFFSIKAFEDRITAISTQALSGGLEINLSKSFREEVLLQKSNTESGQLIRIVAPEKFGGMMESFKLPNGTTLDEAFWDGDKLKITFNY